MRRALQVAIAGLMGLLVACASVPPVPGSPDGTAMRPDWPQRRTMLQELTRFELKGRIAVAAGDEGFSAGLRWQQRDADALIELDGPFGVGGLRLRASGEAIELTNARGERLDGEAARAELERRLGFDLPVTALRYWIRGVPDPAAGFAAERLEPGSERLAALEQGGWKVEYAAYVEVPPAGDLPRRMTASRESTRLRMVIEDWSPGPPR